MRERYEIETIEQLRAIADMLRVRIIDLLEKQAMTVTQLGEKMGLAPARVHYHVRELERVGLLELVETREKGGILEKYYQPVAHIIVVNKTLLSNAPDDAQKMIHTLLDQVADGYLRAFRQVASQSDPVADTSMAISFTHLHLTQEERKQIMNQIHSILQPFEGRAATEDSHEVEMVLLSYPIVPSAEEPEAETLPVQASWVVGAAMYTRNDLLKARNEHRRLDLSVIGLCHFANNIEAELVEEVIRSFKLVGTLRASAEVKEVLKQKEVQA